MSEKRPDTIKIESLVDWPDKPFAPWGCVETVYLKTGEHYTLTLESDPAVTPAKVAASFAKCSAVKILTPDALPEAKDKDTGKAKDKA